MNLGIFAHNWQFCADTNAAATAWKAIQLQNQAGNERSKQPRYTAQHDAYTSVVSMQCTQEASASVENTCVNVYACK